MTGCTATYIGTATLLLEIGELRLVTDPSFAPAGTKYNFEAAPGISLHLHKLSGPAIRAAQLGRIDAALVSHDEHFDNLDDAGRALIAGLPKVLTTPAGSARLGANAIGLAPWQSRKLGHVTVTAVPARHGPEGSETVVGHVTGFVLEWPSQQHGALYISGDTVLHDELAEIGARFKIAAAVLHLGAGSFDVAPEVRVSMDAADGVSLADTLGVRTIVPVHYDGWEHFSEPRDVAAQILGDRAIWLIPGTPTALEI